MMLRTSLMVCMLPTLLVLAADKEPQYEMTTYVMGLFYKGPNWTAEETAETRRIQEGHLANFRKMADAGKLIVAGPFTEWVSLGVLALRFEGKLEWDSEKMRITNNAEANKLIKPTFRKGWTLG